MGRLAAKEAARTISGSGSAAAEKLFHRQVDVLNDRSGTHAQKRVSIQEFSTASQAFYRDLLVHLMQLPRFGMENDPLRNLALQRSRCTNSMKFAL